MTKSYRTCWDPSVNRAAWTVLEKMLPDFSPMFLSEYLKITRVIDGSHSVEMIDVDTADRFPGFDSCRQGLGWHLARGKGSVWLMIPGYRHDGEIGAWTGPPHILLDGVAATADALRILSAMARLLCT